MNPPTARDKDKDANLERGQDRDRDDPSLPPKWLGNAVFPGLTGVFLTPSASGDSG